LFVSKSAEDHFVKRNKRFLASGITVLAIGVSALGFSSFGGSNPIAVPSERASVLPEVIVPDVIVPDVARPEAEPAPAEAAVVAEDSVVLGPVPGLPLSVPIGSSIVASATQQQGLIEVRVGPSELTPVGWNLSLVDEFLQPRVFRVLEEKRSWVRVQVPTRPNGSEGWINKADVDLDLVSQRVLIDISDRSVIVWEGDEVVLDTTGVVGRPTTPTPTGSYYVRSVFEWKPDSVYGPWVIPLSAYSEAIDEINGGDAVIAIHGTVNPELLGRSLSLGCVRLHNDVVTQLAAIVRPGTPVEIVP